MTPGRWALIVGLVLLLGGGFFAWQRTKMDAGSPGGTQEYGALDGRTAAPVAEPIDATPKNAVDESAAAAKAMRADPGQAVPSGGLRPGERVAVAGRPASPFDPSILDRRGFSAEEIVSIQENFGRLVDALKGSDPNKKIQSPIRLTPEERDRNRRERERHLEPAEYDAALLATRQLNRAYFKSGPRPGSPAARAGIQKGDDLIEINGTRVFDLLDFTDARDSIEEGELHRLVVGRRGKLFDVTLKCCRPGWRGVAMRLAPPLEAEGAPTPRK